MTDTSGKVYHKAMEDMAKATDEEIIGKFKGCCQSAVRPIAYDRVQRFIDDVGRLETLADLDTLVTLVD